MRVSDLMVGSTIQTRIGRVGDPVLSQMEGEVLARHRRSSRCRIYSGQADVLSDASRPESRTASKTSRRGPDLANRLTLEQSYPIHRK